MYELIIVAVATAIVFWFIGLFCGLSADPIVQPLPPFDSEKEYLRHEVRSLEFKLHRVRTDLRCLTLTCARQTCCPRCCTDHIHPVYAQTPNEQEIIDLIHKSSGALDELKKKFKVK